MESAGSILIIDDDEDFRKSLRRLLKIDGFTEIEAASSFEEAASIDRLGSFDVILLDRKLPDGTAEQILPRLKELAPDPSVIILTGFADLESTIEVFREGAADFLTKPVNREILRSTVQRNVLMTQSRAGLRNHAQVLQHVHDAVISTSPDGTIKTWNSAAERIYGYTPEEMIGESFALLFFPEDQRLLSDEIIPTLQKSGFFDMDIRARRKCGTEVHVALRLSDQRDDSSNLLGIIGCSNDITEQRRLQEQLLQISEDEKRRIGQDLHDDLCQQLGGIACVAKAVQHSLEKADAEQAQALGEVVTMVNEANMHARSIARGFMPVALETGGLLQALRELAATNEKLFNVACIVQAAEDVDLSNEGGVQIFRIVQESISNAIKHGAATEIGVTVGSDGASYIFEICDNGNGISEAGNRGNGMGLVTMDLRAKVLGGHLTVAPRDSGGTTVKCKIPIPSKP